MSDPVQPFAMPTPEALAALEQPALDALLAEAVAAFDAGKAADVVTAESLAALTALAADIKTIRAECDLRIQAATEAQEAIDALEAEVHGAPTAEGGEGEPVEGEEGGEVIEPEAPVEGEPVEGGEVAPEDAAVEGEVVTGELVTASARPLNMAALRARQPKQKLPEPVATGPALPVITASSDVPGVSTGEQIDMDSLVQAVIGRANGLSHGANGSTAIVASYAMQFPELLKVDSDKSAAAGTQALLAAADQRRLPGGDLTASGGWCAVNETIYTIADVACPDMLWSAPEIQLTRGGINFYRTPTLDVSALTWIHTEANDIAAATKPCFAVPCPEPESVRCEAHGVCIEAGILTERFFPELVSWYVRNSMVAHEIRISQAMFTAAAASGYTVTGDPSFAAFTAVFGQVALQAADLIEKHSLCEGTAIEVVFPFWAKNLFLADIARQNGMSPADIDPAIIARAFSTLGVAIQWVRGNGPQVPADIGGANPAVAWPDVVPFLIYPAGTFQIGRGPSVDLGAVYDSTKFATNDYTALWTEECVALVNRGPESRYVNVPVCPDGTTGAINIGTEVVCPIDAGTSTS